MDGLPVRDGLGQPTGESEVVQRPWCRILETGTTEAVGNAIIGQKTIKFEIRYSKQMENPDTNMYIEFKGETFDIISSNDIDERNEKMEIVAIKRR